MYEPKSLIHSNGSTVTMSSLEMVEYINSMRVDGDPPLTHANFLAKVDKVLGETSHSFECDLPDSYGRSRRGYRFPKREACLMAMSYSYDLQAKVFDKMSELEQAIKAPSTDQLPIEVASRTFNALHSVGVTIGLQSNVAAISANQATLRLTGNNMLELIGHTHLASEVQDLILTPTKLGHRTGCPAWRSTSCWRRKASRPSLRASGSPRTRPLACTGLRTRAKRTVAARPSSS